MKNPEFEIKKIIFLTYVNRSGSTFLANTLSRSEEIMVFPEAEILINLLLVKPEAEFNLLEKIETQIKLDSKLKYWELITEDLTSLRTAPTNFDAFVNVLLAYRNKFKPNAKIFLFKAERILFLYENITIHFAGKYNLLLVALVRDPRGIYESQKRTEMSSFGSNMSKNPVFTAIRWNRFVIELKSFRSREDIIQVRYENLVLKYNATCGKLCCLIGVRKFDYYSEGDLMRRLPDDQLNKHKIINKGPLQKKINLWEKELNKKEIYLIEKYSEKFMRFLKYQPTTISKQRFLKLDILGTTYLLNYYLRWFIKKVLVRIIKKVNL